MADFFVLEGVRELVPLDGRVLVEGLFLFVAGDLVCIQNFTVEDGIASDYLFAQLQDILFFSVLVDIHMFLQIQLFLG